MEQIGEELKEDMQKLEQDSKKIDCYAILDLIGHCIKCFIDSIKSCVKIKISQYNILWSWSSNLKSFELIDFQDNIQDIYHLKRNNHISDLHEEETEELQCFKKLFEDIQKDFQELGI